MKPTVAFIGLGIMGGPMARRLLAAGYPVTAWSRTPASVDRIVADGARGATSVHEAVREADVIITMLPDSPQVEEVALGPDGIVQSCRRGAVYIDMSSISPSSAVQVATAAEAAGIEPLDAPVSGGERGAIDGTLSVMVGGAESTLERVRELLDVLGKTVVHVGPSGTGQTVKAANQLIVAGTIELVAESLVFLDAHGVDLEAAVSVLAGGLAGNRVLDQKAAGMIAHEFEPGFRIDLHHKDMGNALLAAREAGVAIPLGSLAADLVSAARAQGLGSLDHTALLIGVEQMSGRAAERTQGHSEATP